MTNKEDYKSKQNVCPHNEGKLCIQVDNVKELRELIDNTTKDVKGVVSNVENMNDRVSGLSEAMLLMAKNVDKVSENIDKVFKLHFDKALSDKDEFSELKIKDIELEKLISEISHKSDVDNMMQDHNITNSQLDELMGKRKDRKSLWQKAQMTAIGLGVALLINSVVDFVKELIEMVQTVPK